MSVQESPGLDSPPGEFEDFFSVVINENSQKDLHSLWGKIPCGQMVDYSLGKCEMALPAICKQLHSTMSDFAINSCSNGQKQSIEIFKAEL